jgi:hypothetical protein
MKKHLLNASLLGASLAYLALSMPAMADVTPGSSSIITPTELNTDQASNTLTTNGNIPAHGQLMDNRLYIRTANNFAVVDRDGDRVISRAEYMNSGNTADFVALDMNNDGVISRSEYDNYNRVGSSDYNRMYGPDYNRTGTYSYNNTYCTSYSNGNCIGYGRNNRIGSYGIGNAVTTNAMLLGNFTQLDVNGDNRLSRNEFRSSGSNLSFNMIDRNRNGYISRYELNRYLNRVQ